MQKNNIFTLLPYLSPLSFGERGGGVLTSRRLVVTIDNDNQQRISCCIIQFNQHCIHMVRLVWQRVSIQQRCTVASRTAICCCALAACAGRVPVVNNDHARTLAPLLAVAISSPVYY